MKKSVTVNCDKCGSSEETLVESSASSHQCRFCGQPIELKAEKKEAKKVEKVEEVKEEKAEEKSEESKKQSKKKTKKKK